ncbi:phosphatase PAP2 family protein [Luteipulveratus flavus]|uniref:Phosphatase PAP2 family protein n=1 Tax=Luteipulveratus flavus TaxID=3031728 RepID=A0ABT6CB40_9MICO|nr:phosphatase PAP2 family protein [Luteipulveratus sp. YIM 133296]MDF8266005.1 phosphatase PAP2 family protein [Luteipulveratus sp. YIM 133296]
MPFLTRYEDDPSKPSVGSALKDMAVRAVAPGFLVFGLILAVGFLLVGPLKSFGVEEEGVNKDLAGGRTSTWDTITMLWSHIGNTEYVIGVAVLVALVVWWRTKQWWYAVVPILAISLQATIFVIATAIIGRPRPEVTHLDPAPPTSSYPSGHQGASTALYVSFVLMATRISNPVLRRIVMVLCAIAPVLVGYARLYRGMHHPSDVAMGAVNGILSALLAWGYLRRDRAGDKAGERVVAQTRA